MSDQKCADGSIDAAGLLQWRTSRAGNGVVVAFAGEIDLSTASVLGEVLAKLVDSEPRVIIGEAVSFLDSSGISRLLRAARNTTDVGCDLTVRHPTGTVFRVLEVSGVDEVLRCRAAGHPPGGSLAS